MEHYLLHIECFFSQIYDNLSQYYHYYQILYIHEEKYNNTIMNNSMTI